VIENLKDKVDKVIVGGAMAFTFNKAWATRSEIPWSSRTCSRRHAHQKQRPGTGVKFYLPSILSLRRT